MGKQAVLDRTPHNSLAQNLTFRYEVSFVPIILQKGYHSATKSSAAWAIT